MHFSNSTYARTSSEQSWQICTIAMNVITHYTMHSAIIKKILTFWHKTKNIGINIAPYQWDFHDLCKIIYIDVLHVHSDEIDWICNTFKTYLKLWIEFLWMLSEGSVEHHHLVGINFSVHFEKPTSAQWLSMWETVQSLPNLWLEIQVVELITLSQGSHITCCTI